MKKQTNQSQPQTSKDAIAAGLSDGLIIDGSRGIYRVETDAGLMTCTIRGKLRKQLTYAESTTARRNVQKVTVREGDPVAIGDRVRVQMTGGNSGVIEAIVARAGGAFTRGDPDTGHDLTSIAGLDQMLFVFAAASPEPNPRLLDRFLVVAAAQDVPACICINKVDLGVAPWLATQLDVYRAIGYPVLLTSTATGEGIAALRDRLAGHTSALLGPSGVGKSSLLNALQPDLALRVSTVSAANNKGRHTTTGARLCPLDGPAGGYIADTAGIKQLALDHVLDDLDRCFIEFRPLLGSCRLNDCSHIHEPDCAIRAAVHHGTITTGRYDSYCRILTGGAALMTEQWNAIE